MDIKSWKIMLAVDDYGSFTRVGAELGYTQSGITQMMKNLEKKVGFPLYIKDHHGITLTNEAKSLIPAIRTLLNADEVIHQEIAALNGAQKGTIRIGTYLSCSIHWIPKIIREFQQKHPDIIIQVVEGVEGELADWIQEFHQSAEESQISVSASYERPHVCCRSKKRSTCPGRRNPD